MTEENLPIHDSPARRLRAMWAYSALEQGDFVAAVGHGASPNHLRRRDAATPSREMLIAAADLVGWSREFALRGPASIEESERSLDARVEELETGFANVMKLYSSLMQTLKQSATSDDTIKPFEDLLRASTVAARERPRGRGAAAEDGPGQGQQGRAAAGDDG